MRVVAEPRRRSRPTVPVRHELDLGELVAAAGLAGDVPLPIRVGRPGSDDADRMAERLAGPSPAAEEQIAAGLRRAADEGPDGARASLADRGLLVGERLDPTVAAALQAVAGAPLLAVLDVAVTRRAGTLRLRSWFGGGPALVGQLATVDGLHYELAAFDPRLWVSQLTRAITVTLRAPGPTPAPLPDHLALPTELLVGSEKARREHRTDLLAPMAAAHAGRVRVRSDGQVRDADSEEVLALLHTLGDGCRGRLRLLTSRRDRTTTPSVAAWLLFDDGWHELRPGPDGTSVLRRRDARDLGLITRPQLPMPGEAA